MNLRLARASCALVVSAWLGLLAPSFARAEVLITTIGTPTFNAVDIHLFSAPIGTAASGYAEFAQTEQALLPAPNHVPNPQLGIGPGAPHAGPYDHEFADGLAANGYAEATQFTAAQYSNGNGVYAVFMLVPGAGSATGSSPDFASGPILQNDVFPLTVFYSTYTNGAFNDFSSAFKVPAINQVTGFETLDGHSHIPLFFADSQDFAALPLGGAYEYRIAVLDKAGNGYAVVMPFTVVPEPASWLLTAMGCVALGLRAARRRTLGMQRPA